MIQYKKYFLGSFGAMLLTLGACNKTEVLTPPPSPPAIISANTVIEGNTKFALNIYRELVDESKNQILSPYSISTAIAMAYAGADGNTATEIQNVFGFGSNTSNFHTAYNQLTNSIENNINSSPNSEVNIVNKIWRSPNLTFLPTYEQIMTNSYLSPIDITDFTQSAAARQLINGWVDTETHHLIPELLPDGFINNQTATVLVNAVYFKSDWVHQFDPFRTSPQSFTTSNNSTVSAPIMSDLIPTNELKFTEDADAEVLELFFKDQKSSMLIVLPKNASLGINSFVQQYLNYTRLSQWLDDLAYPVANSNFSVGLPKWKFNSDFDIAETLEAMGMVEAFKETANFQKMSELDLFIEKIKHIAVIEAHEGGVEAAAATGVGFGTTSIPPVARVFIANRPFVFLIKDTETDAILFIGHVQNPTEQN